MSFQSAVASVVGKDTCLLMAMFRLLLRRIYVF